LQKKNKSLGLNEVVTANFLEIRWLSFLELDQDSQQKVVFDAPNHFG